MNMSVRCLYFGILCKHFPHEKLVLFSPKEAICESNAADILYCTSRPALAIDKQTVTKLKAGLFFFVLIFNPFSALVCKFPGWKMHARIWKLYFPIL